MATATVPLEAMPPVPLECSYWVIPGLVLAGEHPDGGSRSRTRQRLKRLLAAGIESFLDLTQPTELPRYDGVLPRGIQYTRKSIRDHCVPETRAQMVDIVDCLQRNLRAGQPIYVHCFAGIGRTGTAVGCLLVERGLSGEQALQRLNQLWRQSRRSSNWPHVPETPEQEQYVRGWAPANSIAVPAVGEIAAPDVPSAEPNPRGKHHRVEPTLGLDALPRAVSLPAAAGAGVALTARGAVLEPAIRRSSMPPLDAPPPRPTRVIAPPRSTPPTTAREASDPLLSPDALAAAKGLRERFVGALVGLAVADAVAASTQYRRPGSFTPVGDMLGGGPFDLPRGAWSDDTAMALCLAESLIECTGFDARDQAQRYSRWQQEGYLSATGQCVGITANTARALAVSQWRRQVFAGSHDPKHLDPEPLSRVAPVVLFYFSDAEAALANAAEAARTTCQSAAVLDACRQLASILHAALSGESKAQLLAEVPPVSDAAATRNSTAASALAAALWAFGSTGNYREAVLRAANLGGNCDVVAAVCGQIAGAHYGLAAIPPAWRNSLAQRPLVESFADRLLAHSLLTLAG